VAFKATTRCDRAEPIAVALAHWTVLHDEDGAITPELPEETCPHPGGTTD
jgi:hypothetical protein